MQIIKLSEVTYRISMSEYQAKVLQKILTSADVRLEMIAREENERQEFRIVLRELLSGLCGFIE